MRTRLQRWLFTLHRVEELLLLFVFLAVVLLAVTQIVARNLFGMSWSWIEPASKTALIWIAMMGGLIASRRHAHLHINLAAQYLSPVWLAWLQRCISFICCLILAFLAWHAARLVWEEYQFADLAFLSVPVWLCMLIMPMGFALMSFRHLLQVFWLHQSKGPY